MALASTSQDDFSAGIFRGRKAPSASAYDLVNCLIDDTGLPFRRGGSSYFTDADAGVTLTTLADMNLAPGRRLLAWGEYPDAKLYVLDEGAGTFTSFTPTRPEVASRVVQLGSIGVFQRSNGSSIGTNLLLYAGSLKTAPYTIGTVAITAAALTLTGSGTSWSANVDVGMLFQPVAGGPIGVVASIDSNTSITLREPWAGATISGVGYSIAERMTIDLPASASKLPAIRTFAASVGSPPRLVFCTNNRAYFSERGAVEILSDQYHELPASEVIVGADSIDDTLLLFTTGGVWRVSNMAFDAVDAFGNQQHSVAEVSRDVILWGDAGIVGRETAFIVPAVDDVYLFSPDGATVPISGNIRPLYRSYVKAGYRPGVAVIHRGHYILPVLSGTTLADGVTLVDTLVFRLDREATPVTRWAGHAASGAYVRRAGSSTRSPQLLSVAGQRVTDLTDCFDPTAANALDADGTTSDLVIESRDFPTGQQPGFFAKARARYELEDDGSGGTTAPTVAIAFTSDADAGTFTTLTDRGEQGGAAGWGVSAGDKYQWATVGKARERGRLRITVSGACARFVLRSVELLIRQSGKQ